MAHTHALPFCKLAVRPIFIKFTSTQPSALNFQGPWVSVIELPGGVVHNSDFPISVLGSVWLARTSLMASSALLGSISSRRCSASNRGGLGQWEAGGSHADRRRRWQARKPWAKVYGYCCCWGRPLVSTGSGEANTCILVRLLFCGTCGLATILLPRTKSQPVGVSITVVPRRLL